MHVPIHLVDAPKIYESEDSELVDFIDNYITCALPDEAKYLEISNLIKKLQCHHYTTTCKQKKGVACTFNASWVPSDETRTVHSEENMDEVKVKQGKKLN